MSQISQVREVRPGNRIVCDVAYPYQWYPAVSILFLSLPITQNYYSDVFQTHSII